MLLDESQVVQAHHMIVLSNIIHPDDSHLVEQLSLKKRYLTVPGRSEMQSERKEKREKAKGKLQSRYSMHILLI